MTDTTMSNSRADRLIDEFREGAAKSGGFKIGHGIAQVLQHIADTEGNTVVFGAVSIRALEALVANLTAPTLLDRALNGDAQAARQWLHQAGFTDKQGQLMPQFQSQPQTRQELAKAALDRLIALIPTEGAIAMAEPIRIALEQLND